MTQVTSNNKKYFKNYLRSNKKLFTSKYLSYSIPRIKSWLDSYDQNLNDSSDLKILNFDSGDSINLRGNIFDGQYLYLPGLENDIIKLQNGEDWIILGFDSYGRFYYGQYLIPLGTQINLGNKKFTVTGLGGALLEVTDIPPGPTYNVVESSTAIDEGDTVTFTINTTNVEDGTTLYYTIDGDVDENDFTDGELSGSVTINNNTASFTKTLANDISPIGTEGSETFTVNIRLDSTSGTIVTSSSEVNVDDTSILSYAVSESTTQLNEGDSVTFTILTAGVPNGTTLYYTIFGTVSANDFTDNSLSGSIIIDVNTFNQVYKTLVEDLTVVGFENQENFVFQLRTGSVSGPIVATSSTITVEDTSVSSYTITPSSTTIAEGETVTFTITTTGVADETTLYYSTPNTTIISPASGSFVINNNTGTFQITANEDEKVVATKTFSISIRSGSVTGSILANSTVLTITNTTTYQFILSSTELQEDGSVTINIESEFVPDGSVLYYNVTGAAANSSDLFTLSGPFTINDNLGTFNISAKQDYSLDDGEIILIEIRTDSISGTIIETLGPITITDKPFTIDVVPQQLIINESTLTSNSTLVVDINTTDVEDGASFTATIVGINASVNSDDFGGSLSYTFTITNNTGSITIPITRDGKTEGSETFTIDVVDQFGSTLATSPVVVITDASYIGSRKTNKTFGPILVNRDEGVVSNASDWYTICDIDSVPDNSKIALFVDISGSMNLDTVKASYDQFMQKLQERNIEVVFFENRNEDWITPFNTAID